MKKIIALTLVTASLAATSAFGQGWISLSSSRSQVYDGFTTAGTAALNTGTIDVGLFWAANATANPMASLLASTPTSGNSTTTESYTVSQAWTTLLSASGWTLAQNAQNGNSSVISPTATKGSVSYNSGNNFDITGTTAGASYAFLEVSWNAAYATPTLAQAAGSAIGWSYMASLATGISSTDLNTTSPTFANYGTFVPAVIPEPTTLALAALGGAAMLMIRRKK
jgi:hypothetical protein